MLYLITAAVESGGAGGLSLTDLAALVTAVGGIIVGVLAARKGAKADTAAAENVEQNSLLEGYGQIVKELQGEVSRIRLMYTEDSAAWRAEKAALMKQIEWFQENFTPAEPTTRRKRTPKPTE